MRDKEKQSAYNKMYRQKNPEFIKKIQKEYYDKHREKRIENAKNWQKNNPTKLSSTRHAYMSTPKGRLSSIKASANTRKIDFELTDEQAISIMEKKCHYCGQISKIGIDRIDSDKHYTFDNCLPCCAMCNKMKNTYSKEDFILQCKTIAYFLGTTT